MKFLLTLLVCLVTFTAPALARHPRPTASIIAVQESLARAKAMYPEYDAEGTPLYRAIQDEIHRQKEINPSYFKNTDWPERIARECAAVLGIDPARPMQASTK